MNWADLSNGGFEALSGVVSLLNVRRLLRDRNLQGVSVWPAAFFTAWGVFNLGFYPYLGLWWSFTGGLAITGVNIAWLALAWRFRKLYACWFCFQPTSGGRCPHCGEQG